MDRVQKLLSNAGVTSRRDAEDLIAAGRVTVDGRVISLGDKASEDQDIRVDGERVRFERKRYLAFHKPRNILTTLGDPSRKKDITSFITVKERVYPVGRLDYDAEGLLLLTNDGDFANRVMHPRYEKEKTYLCVVDKEIEDVSPLRGVTKLRDGDVEVHEAVKVHKTGVRLTIHEGKKHVVKRLLRKHGYYVKRLKRVAIGPVELGSLKPGEMRDLTEAEITALRG